MKKAKTPSSKKELRELVEVLEDVERSVQCAIALGGSVAQRELIPDFDRIPNDIDVLLLGGSFEACPVLPTVKDQFWVVSITECFDGYYFGLIHKRTKKWVDLFAIAYDRSFTTIAVGGKKYKAETLASQVLYLAQDLLRRISGGREVRKKWVKKLESLASQKCLDEVALEAEFSEHTDFLLMNFPKSIPYPQNAREFIRQTTSYAVSSISPARSSLVKRLLLVKNASRDSIETSNGITVDSKWSLLRSLL